MFPLSFLGVITSNHSFRPHFFQFFVTKNLKSQGTKKLGDESIICSVTLVEDFFWDVLFVWKLEQFMNPSRKPTKATSVTRVNFGICIWLFPEMVVPPKHPEMIIFSRKTNGCWVPLF